MPTRLLLIALLAAGFTPTLRAADEPKPTPPPAGQAAPAAPAPLLGHGAMQYRVVPGWGRLDPKQNPIKNCHAMVQLKSGDHLALCDDTRHNFLRFSPDGKLNKAWITEYPGAHGLELFEKDGKELLVVVDSGWAVRAGVQYSERGRAAITDTNGQLILSLPDPLSVGAYTPGMKYMPCDAAVAPNGDIYIADGYGSNWVLQFDANGRFIRKFGGPTDPDRNARLNNAHGISVDLRDPQKPRLIVSSRSDNKLKYFTLDGKYLSDIELPGAFGGQAAIRGDKLYVGVCWSKKNGTGAMIGGPSGFVIILDKDDKVVSCPGGIEPKYVDGKLQPLYQATPDFAHVHDLCVDRDGNIIVVQWNAGGASPIKLEPVKP